MHRVFRSAVVVAGLVLTLGGASSWGGPPNNDVSDANGNTAGGTGALQSNTTGSENTASGFFALQSNTTGHHNTASGAFALFSNTSGSSNTAFGDAVLFNNTTGSSNTASGFDALAGNTTGIHNTAFGAIALFNNTTGSHNTASGFFALFNNTTGNNNIAVGEQAGLALTTGSSNIYLGHTGAATESTTMRLGQAQTRTFIAGITGVPVTGSAVVISTTGRLGIVPSAARYKRAIHAMGERSRGLLQLRPVTFRYKHDPQGQRQYGLIAEEVATVYPELVTRGAKGEVESVQYHALIPMLLNEVQHQQQALGVQARQLSAQSQQLTALQAQTERLQAVLGQQTAAVAARLERLEAGATRPAMLTSR